jgi:FtsZ-interacting cell division protein ZipA
MSTVLIVVIVVVALLLLGLLVFGGKRKRQTKKADQHLEAASNAAGRAERERVVAEHHKERAREVDPRVDD